MYFKIQMNPMLMNEIDTMGRYLDHMLHQLNSKLIKERLNFNNYNNQSIDLMMSNKLNSFKLMVFINKNKIMVVP